MYKLILTQYDKNLKSWLERKLKELQNGNAVQYQAGEYPAGICTVVSYSARAFSGAPAST